MTEIPASYKGKRDDDAIVAVLEALRKETRESLIQLLQLDANIDTMRCVFESYQMFEQAARAIGDPNIHRPELIPIAHPGYIHPEMGVSAISPFDSIARSIEQLQTTTQQLVQTVRPGVEPGSPETLMAEGVQSNGCTAV